MRSNVEDTSGLVLLCHAREVGLNVCHPHLRLLASTTVGLQNNLSGDILRRRLNRAWDYRKRLHRIRCGKSRWFLKTRRPKTETDRLGVFRYPALLVREFLFDEVRIFGRFAGKGSWGRSANVRRID